MVLARGNREPSQALTGAALSGVLLCEYHFVTAPFYFLDYIRICMTRPTKIVGAKTLNLRYNVYSAGNTHSAKGIASCLVCIHIFPQD